MNKRLFTNLFSQKLVLLIFALPLLVVVPIVTAQHQLPDPVMGAWSNDGRQLAVTTPDHVLLCRNDRATFLTITPKQAVRTIAFSSTGELLATWDDSQTASVWDTATGKLVAERSFSDGDGYAVGLTFFHQDQEIALNYIDRLYFAGGTLPNPLHAYVSFQSKSPEAQAPSQPYQTGVYLWDYHSQAKPPVIPLGNNVDRDSQLVFSGDTDLFAVRSYPPVSARSFSASVALYDAQTRTPVSLFLPKSNRFLDLQFDPNQDYPSHIATLSDSGIVQFWILGGSDVQQDFALTALPGRIRVIAYSADGNTLATGGIDSIVRLWDTRSGELLSVIANQPADVHQLAFDSEGTLIAFGNSLTYPRTWNVVNQTSISDFRWMPVPTATPMATASPVPSPTASASATLVPS